ncbi:MAG: hypothetical protein K9H64_07720 [Bacteroidales bacterium]|nr:hypothetical protein [Bacteroidales bacterium]MCF8455672.1 hypothetical protein [Bacteroidales bacterium]
MKTRIVITILSAFMLLQACEKDSDNSPMALNPDTAGDVSIDRFSADAGHLFVRDASNGFPGENEPINFDNIPAFITKGLGPNGEMTQYYNFDVMSTIPAPIYVLFKENETMPVDGQLNIVNVIPGSGSYNDFWLVTKVTVPSDYVANTITSYSEIISMGYAVTPTTIIVNCPIVPKGSVASKRFTSESTELTRGWYNSKVVYYFNFSEKDLMAVNGMVPTSDIYVSFNINPDQANGGPPSGFMTVDGTAAGQTHNVPETIPTDAAYSPLWDVQIYDNADFSSVMDLSTATMANIMAMDAAIVNCPIVSVQ